MNDGQNGAPERRDAEWARAIAAATVEEMLTRYGFDTGNPRDMQEDLSWVRRTRKMSEKLGTRILLTTMTIFTAGIFAAIWAYVKK